MLKQYYQITIQAHRRIPRGDSWFEEPVEKVVIESFSSETPLEEVIKFTKSSAQIVTGIAHLTECPASMPE